VKYLNKLFSAYTIKGVNIKNRICIPPMVTKTSEDGYVKKETVKRYLALAKGGAGLIIQEATCINPDGRLAKIQLGLWSDDQIAGLKSIVDAVHKEDCKILIQIHHAGVTGISANPLCPSPYEFVSFGRHVVGRVMTTEDIKSVQNDFIKAARRAYAAGYDGIELHGCHGYLISQFLNNRINKRTDEYGSNPEKFVLEILEGIRKVTPTEFIVGIRMGGFEPTLEAGIEYAKVFDQKGFDFLDISYGFTGEQDIHISEDYQFSNAVYAAQKIKELVSVPVFAVHKITSAKVAEEILNETKVDLVDMGKGSIINPNWANDAKEGIDTGKCFYCSKCMWFGQARSCPGIVAFEKSRKK
jgi:2,4-dienoyl-CoA reductase-like NADH-dependent reductase (Old Yellow Enzyme family)